MEGVGECYTTEVSWKTRKGEERKYTNAKRHGRNGRRVLNIAVSDSVVA